MAASPLMPFIKVGILMLTPEQPYSGLVPLFKTDPASSLVFCRFLIFKKTITKKQKNDN